MKKIEKLDRILTQKIETEREVKRERFALEKDFQRQIHRLIDEKGVENVIGSQQLLSLCAATDLKEESINQDIDNDDFPHPIFTTQIDSEFYKDGDGNCTEVQSPEDEVRSTDSPRSSTKGDKQKIYKQRVDFIKRNINLASQYNETVALTDEEKNRLEELLADDNDLLIGENPFSTPAIKDDGFRLSLENQQQMEDIDTRLRDFLSEDEYNSNILGESQSSTSIHSLQEDRSLLTLTDKNHECGEKVLNDGVAQRNMVQRLCDIEKRLQELRFEATTPTSGDDDLDSTTTTPRSQQQGRLIDPDLLRSLLDVNSRLTSESRSICDSVRTNSVSCFEGDGDDESVVGNGCNNSSLPIDVSLDIHDVSDNDNDEEEEEEEESN